MRSGHIQQSSVICRIALLLAMLLSMLSFNINALAATMLTTTATQGLSCIPERIGSVNCTANDFTVGATFSASPGTPPFCVAGQSFDFLVDLDLTSNSPDRYDVGFFVGENRNRPDTSSTADKCSVATFPTMPSPFYAANANTCGDYQGPGQQSITRINQLHVKCDGDSAGALAIPYTLVYSQNVGDTVSCAGPSNVVPGTKSKCQSGTNSVTGAVAVDVGAYVDVTKRTTPSGSSQSFSFTASVPAGGRIIAQTAGIGTATSNDDTYSSTLLSDAGNTVTVNISDGQTVRFLTTAKSTATSITIVEQATTGWNPTTAISCSSVRGTIPVTINNTNRSLTAQVDTNNSALNCTFSNTKQRNLTLQKSWVNARVNDAATVTATNLTSLSAVANSPTETDTGPAQTVNVGSSITLGESFTAGNANHYNASVNCTSSTGAVTVNASNQMTMPDADVTCGYTNSRIAQQLSLDKTWQNAVSGHTATATTTGGTNNPTFSSTSTGNNTTVGNAVTVYAGDVVSLPAEIFGGGGTAAQYNSRVACSGGSTLASGAVARSITISNNTTATVCTYTNARKSATLTLFKTWSVDSIAGDTVTVTSSGFAGNATSGTSTATAAGNTTTGAAVTVYAGETGSFAEAFGTGSAANYTAALTCSGNTNVLSGNSLTINPADTAITCGYTNTASGTDLSIEKTGASSVTQGSTVSYSIKVWNKGPVVANSSTFADNVPTTLSNVIWNCVASGTANCGSISSGTGNNISVTTGRLPVNTASTAPTSGSYLTFNLTGTANTIGTINNTATVAVTSGNDAVSANNSSQTSTTVTTPAAITPDPAVKEARFSIDSDLPTIYRGQSGTQLITIKNLGPDAATDSVAKFKLRSQNGITVTSVKVMGGASCTVAAGEWSCSAGSVANGANFQLQVSYDTTSSAALGTAIQADIRVSSNEFNPGSGVGETLYKVWGSNQTEEIRPNGAFWAGYLGPQGSVPDSGYNDETTPIINAWPISQLSPTGSYLVTAAPGSNNNIYAASSTNASPMINRIITNMGADPARSVTLPSLDANSPGDNRRAWEFRTGVFVPQATNVTFCVGNTSVGINDGAYIVLDGTVIGTQDSYAPGGYVSATVNFTQGYHTLSYRILNQNTYNGSAEIEQGLYGAIGILYNGSCNVAGFDAWVNTQVPASINIVEKPVVSITGRVFEDNSGTTSINSNAYNGTQEAGEAGIAGSQVSLTNCGTTTVATTQTTANGDYSFDLGTSELPVGNFCIAQTNLTGYSSVSGGSGYNRATDMITVANTGATSYSGRNFGDARLNILLTEDGQQTITAGGAADYPHRLTAQSVMNITAISQIATQQPAASSDSSWQAVLYRDINCNGNVDSGENLMTQSLPLSLKANEQICLVQRVYAPANASMGAQHNAQLQASFSVTLADNSQITGSSGSRQDTTLLGSAGLSMQKGVRTVASCPSTASDTGSFVTQNQAQSGNYLEYEITYRNNSSKNLVNVSIKDSIPSGTVYQSIVCSVNPGLSCTPSHTNGTLLWQTNGTLSPNQQGKVRFCVQVP